MKITKNKKTVLITGSTSGIGKYSVVHLARAGHRVIATGRNLTLLERLRDEAKMQGLELLTVRLDVTDAKSIDDAVLAVDAATEGRGIDALVNNAGYGLAGPLEMVTDADLRAQFDTNVFGLMAVTRAFVPKMRQRGDGRIVNISSVAGRITYPFLGAYHASKYALEALSDALRMELLPFGIRVVVVEPGSIASAFTERAISTVRIDGPAAAAYKSFVARRNAFCRIFDSIAVGPKTVAKAIERAITARRPSARYVAPFRSRFALAFYRLPVAWVDALVSRLAGIPARLQPSPRVPTLRG
jgi:NAD(P)-dependent dehydrogenase (short-subunit alcohol dehydrogenase family)